MNREQWITVIAITIGVGVAIYLGLNVNPSVTTASASVPSTQSIDNNPQATQAMLQELGTQQQIATDLGLSTTSTSTATPLSSTPANDTGTVA